MSVIVVVDDVGLQRKLKRLSQTLDSRTLLGLIGSDVLKWINDNFRRGGIEAKWKPLAASTIRGRRRGSSAPLQDTGKLKQSFAYEVAGNEVKIGTVNRVAPFHEFGTDPYTIRPVRAKVLRFMGADGPIFTRQVSHPGLAARPMLPSKRLGERIAIATINAIVRQRRGSD